MNRLLARVSAALVGDDPFPTEPTQLDRLGATYPTRAVIRAAVYRGVTIPGGTTLLKPQDVERVTAEVMAAMCPNDDTRRAVEAAEARAWSASRDDLDTGDCAYGEIGHIPTMRTGMHR